MRASRGWEALRSRDGDPTDGLGVRAVDRLCPALPCRALEPTQAPFWAVPSDGTAGRVVPCGSAGEGQHLQSSKRRCCYLSYPILAYHFRQTCLMSRIC